MQDHPEKDRTEAVSPAISASKRILYLCLGFLMLGLGIIGAFLPVMPTTIFVILPRGSLHDHPRSSKRVCLPISVSVHSLSNGVIAEPFRRARSFMPVSA